MNIKILPCMYKIYELCINFVIEIIDEYPKYS